jgi:hypothetical protein
MNRNPTQHTWLYALPVHSVLLPGVPPAWCSRHLCIVTLIGDVHVCSKQC